MRSTGVKINRVDVEGVLLNVSPVYASEEKKGGDMSRG